MANRELKRLMTDIAEGKISQEEADILIKPKKVPQKVSKKQKKATQQGKEIIKSKEDK